MLNYIWTCKIFKLIPILQVLIIKVSFVQFVLAAGTGIEQIQSYMLQYMGREELSVRRLYSIPFSLHCQRASLPNQPAIFDVQVDVYLFSLYFLLFLHSVAGAATVRFVYSACSSIAVYLQINKFTNSYPNILPSWEVCPIAVVGLLLLNTPNICNYFHST